MIHILTHEPAPGLYGTILARISWERKRQAKIRLTYTSVLGLASFAAMFPAWSYFLAEFSKSGFYQYLSLIFSDGWNALPYWKELALTLAESVPVIATVAVLVLVIVLVETCSSIIRDSRTVFATPQTA